MPAARRARRDRRRSGVQVQPEELLALVERADRVEVDVVENLHPAPPKLAAAPDSGWLHGLGQRRFGLGALDASVGLDLGRSLGAVGDQQPREQGAERATAAPMRRPSLSA
jgi:hypothetical protein